MIRHAPPLPAARGFTLVELTIVIAIIAVLASVVIAAMGLARNKAKDAAIRSSIRELAVLAETEFDASGTYAAVQPGCWMGSVAACNSCFTTGANLAQVRALCATIVTNALSLSSYPYPFYAGNAVSNNTKFTFMAALPGSSTYYCLGSSGGESQTTPDPADNWTRAGCYSNP